MNKTNFKKFLFYHFIYILFGGIIPLITQNTIVIIISGLLSLWFLFMTIYYILHS